MALTPRTIARILKLRRCGMTVGEIADAIGWPKTKSLRQLEHICSQVRCPQGFDTRPRGPVARTRNGVA